MLIIPGIDIRNGRCVSSVQGRFDIMTEYNNNPLNFAKSWVKRGVKMLHFVDMDGAQHGAMKNLEIFKKIRKKINIPIEVGGGIRNK